MSASTSPAPRPRRSRKSIAHFPSAGSGLDTDNMSSQSGAKSGKKSRSKSLGPGGLDVLREASGNSQKILPAIRSILKPIIPLSPPKPIPPRTPRNNDGKQGDIFGSPSRRTRSSAAAASASPAKGTADEEQSDKQNELGESIALRSEEEQQTAARKREREEAIRRRDERRKSLANRRVSFAPEATLHTWDVVEMNEDATTSSEATNSTSRQSNGNTLGSDFTHGTQRAPGSEADDPATPTTHDEDINLPDNQHLARQQEHRRGSGVNLDFNDNELSSSPGSIMADDVTGSSFVTNPEEEEDISDTDTYRDDDSTAMDIDEEEVTGGSVGSERTDETSSSSSSATLDARLRQAIQQAGTQRLDGLGDTGFVSQPDETMSVANDIRQKRRNESLIEADFAADQDGQADDETGAMEMTQAVGGIVTKSASRSPSRRSSRAARRRSSGASSVADDQSMELTTAEGFIRRTSIRRESVATVATEDEDMSMELTGVIGGFVNGQYPYSAADDASDRSEYVDMTGQMEVTAAIGRILPNRALSPVTERTEPATEASMSMDFTAAVGAIQKPNDVREDTEAEDETMDMTATMDITKAMGRILSASAKPQDRTTAKRIMEEETEHGSLARSSMIEQPVYPQLPTTESVDLSRTTPEELPTPTRRTSSSPSNTQSNVNPITPSTAGRSFTPDKIANTPVHQLTPQPVPRPTTPSKTPPNRNVAMRRTSPRKLFSQSTRERQPPGKSPAKATEQAGRRATIDPANMLISQTPQLRRLSGQGADQAGLGSPKIAALLDRRTSIGETAPSFTPQGPSSRIVQFADPREIEQEVDHEREKDLSHESGREAMERESDSTGDKDTTMTLRDMINSLTPKKRPDLKGRKSLAIGSGRGLLGKRPVELDEADEDSPKRIQGPDRSPVKSIRLPAPPSKEETTGRIGKLPRFSLGPVSGNIGTPVTENPPAKPSTPRDQQRFRDAPALDDSVELPVTFTQRIQGFSPAPVEDESFEPIQLQDFLNMINVRFMDLETTKRRHTIAPRDRTSTDTASDERKLEDCVAAGVSTIPMLELYQHSCRELKKYISEGRNIVREIESDTLEENPALFKEYMSAAPDVRVIMDNQFKNVKAHARLLSRDMWYEWRMKLLEGLKNGLIKIAEGLVQDSDALEKQEHVLSKVVPSLSEKFSQLSSREESLRRQADEFESSDQEALVGARRQLASADSEWETKQRLLAELKAEQRSQEEQLERLSSRKQQCLDEISESQKLCDEYRGWKMSEVAALKADMDLMGSKTGWIISSIQDDNLELQYRRTLSLIINPASFQTSAAPTPLKLSLAGEDEPTTQERFFLQLLRARLHGLDQASTSVSAVLGLISSGWDIASKLKNSVSDLALSYITDVAITGDESLAVYAVILLREMRTKVKIQLEIRVDGSGCDFVTSTRTVAKVVYGEELKEGNMGDFISSKIGVVEEHGFSRWGEAVRDLETRLIARGKK